MPINPKNNAPPPVPGSAAAKAAAERGGGGTIVEPAGILSRVRGDVEVEIDDPDEGSGADPAPVSSDPAPTASTREAAEFGDPEPPRLDTVYIVQIERRRPEPEFVVEETAAQAPKLPSPLRTVSVTVRSERFVSRTEVLPAQLAFAETVRSIGPQIMVDGLPAFVTIAARVVKVTLPKTGRDSTEVVIDLVHVATPTKSWIPRWRRHFGKDEQSRRAGVLTALTTVFERVPPLGTGLAVRLVGCTPMGKDLAKIVGVHAWNPGRFSVRVEVDVVEDPPEDPLAWLPFGLCDLMRRFVPGPSATLVPIDRDPRLQRVLTAAGEFAGPAIASFGSVVYQDNADFMEGLVQHNATTPMEGTVMATHFTYMGVAGDKTKE